MSPRAGTDSPPDSTPKTNPAPAAADATRTPMAKAPARAATNAGLVVPVASSDSTMPRSSSPRANPVADASAHTAKMIASGLKPRNCT